MVRPHELACHHGIGHQLGAHGCDGCCGLIFGDLAENERKRITNILENRLKEITLPSDVTYIEATVIKELIKLIGENK